MIIIESENISYYTSPYKLISTKSGLRIVKRLNNIYDNRNSIILSKDEYAEYSSNGKYVGFIKIHDSDYNHYKRLYNIYKKNHSIKGLYQNPNKLSKDDIDDFNYSGSRKNYENNLDSHCDKCGSLLLDNGLCPVCDYGEEDYGHI